MKYPFTILLHFVFCATINAQHKLATSRPYPVVDASYKYYLADGNEILAIKGSRSFTFQKFDGEKLLLTSTKSGDLPPGAMMMNNAVKLGDAYYVICSSFQKVFSRQIDFKKGEFKGSWKTLLTTKQPLPMLISRAMEAPFQFSFSPDSSKILVSYHLGEEKKIGLHILDKSLETVWSTEVEIPYSLSKMRNLHARVDQAGNVVIVVKVFAVEKPKSDKDFNNFSLELIKVSNSQKVTTIPVEVPGKHPINLNLFDDRKDGLKCAGVYSNNSDRSGVSGIMTFRLTTDSKITDLKTFDIPVTLINQYASGKEQRKSAKDGGSLEDISIENMVVSKDGGMLLIGEQQQYFRTEPVGGTGLSSSFVLKNNLFLTKLAADGNVTWMKKVPKRQRNVSETFRHFEINGTHHFFYLDNLKNKDIKDDEVPTEHVDGQGGVLTVAKVDDATGNIERIYLADTRNVNGTEVFQLTPNRIIHTIGNEFVFEVYRRNKEDMLVKVKL